VAWRDDLITLLTPVAPLGVVYFSTKAPIPADASDVLSFVETPGFAPEFVQNSPIPAFTFPAAQIVARSQSYEAASDLAKQCYDLCVNVDGVAINGTKYIYIRPLQEPFDLTPDDAGRARVAFNVLGRTSRL
jgi:hypothetical protein